MDRIVPVGIVEQWMAHVRLQRNRALDTIWLIEQGLTLHEGRAGEPLNDATARWLAEQKQVVADVDHLLSLYQSINHKPVACVAAA